MLALDTGVFASREDVILSIRLNQATSPLDEGIEGRLDAHGEPWNFRRRPSGQEPLREMPNVEVVGRS